MNTSHSLLLLGLPAGLPSIHPYYLVGPSHVLAEGLGAHVGISTMNTLEGLFSCVVPLMTLQGLLCLEGLLAKTALELSLLVHRLMHFFVGLRDEPLVTHLALISLVGAVNYPLMPVPHDPGLERQGAERAFVLHLVVNGLEAIV